MRSRARSQGLSLAVVWVLAGACTSSESTDAAGVPEKNQAAATALKVTWSETWPSYVGVDPSSFNTLLSSSPGEGWQKLYQHKYTDAAAAFHDGQDLASSLGEGRAELARAELFAAAWQLSLTLLERGEALYTENSDRIKVTPAGDYFKAVRALQKGDAQTALAAIRAFRASPGAQGSLGPMAAALEVIALGTSGDTAGADKLMAGLDQAEAKLAVAALKARTGQPGAEPPAADALSPYLQRLRVYALVGAGDLAGARTAAASIDGKSPDFSEPSPEGQGERKYYDPLYLEGLARLHAATAANRLTGSDALSTYWRTRAEGILGKNTPFNPTSLTPGPMAPETLPGLIFSPLSSLADVRSDMERRTGAAATSGLMAQYQEVLGPISSEPDQGRQTRQSQDLAKVAQDTLLSSIKASGKEDGLATVEGLQLARSLSYELVRTRARQYIDAGRVLEGMTLLEYSFDKENGSQITYINSPMLFLETARAYCLLGRYREAMNYLYRLLEDYPELWSTYEILGNLSVIGTLDQPGVNAQ